MIKGMSTKEYYTGHGPLVWLDALIQEGVVRTVRRAKWRRQKREWKARSLTAKQAHHKGEVPSSNPGGPTKELWTYLVTSTRRKEGGAE